MGKRDTGMASPQCECECVSSDHYLLQSDVDSEGMKRVFLQYGYECVSLGYHCGNNEKDNVGMSMASLLDVFDNAYPFVLVGCKYRSTCSIQVT